MQVMVVETLGLILLLLAVCVGGGRLAQPTEVLAAETVRPLPTLLLSLSMEADGYR